MQLPFGLDPVFIGWILSLALVLFVFRKNVEIQFPLFLLKSKRLGDWVYEKSRGWRKIVGPVSDVGVVIGFAGMVFVVYFLVKSLINVLTPSGTSAVSIIIPGVRVPGSPVFLPLVYGIISIVILAIVHELAHAIVASSHGVRPKSIALALLLFIPAAGVEIDEKKLSKTPLRTRLRIFAAGSFANFLTALLVLALAFLLSIPAKGNVSPAGTEIVSVDESSPAFGRLFPGDVLVSVNGKSVLALEDFVSIAKELKPGETLSIEKADGAVVEIVAGPREDSPERGRIGVTTKAKVSMTVFGKILVWLLGLFNWVFNLNIGVGIINLFPFPIMDGGRMFAGVMERFFGEKRGKKVNKLAFWVFGPLLALNILIPIVKALFFS